MMQHEITERKLLLDGSGNLTEAGYAKKLLPVYRRSDVKAGSLRIKEWDYYLVANDHYGLALTVADNAYMGLASVSLLNFDEGWEITKSPMTVLPRGRTGLPESSLIGDTAMSGKGYGLFFKNPGGSRTLIAHMNKFGSSAISARIELTDIPEESMVIATPFDKPGHFYYNQKINCMRAAGEVTYLGQTYTFDPSDSFAVLDWGRGVWTYSNTWYWSSASGLVDGVRFGFNLGYGFGDTSAATENMLFYDGKAHKLGGVTFHIPRREGKYDYLGPWTFSSDDGRFEMAFTPILDRAACTSALVIKSDQHQVFGRFSGTAMLDDGRVIQVKDLLGFAERVVNRW